MSERYDQIKKRRDSRRQEWIANNGPCAYCGTWEKLEIDHIDPSTKEYEINRIWTRNEIIRNTELAKCQALCNTCHINKSTLEQKANKPVSHGSWNSYVRDKCRCDTCVIAHTKRINAYRTANRDRINSYHKNYDTYRRSQRKKSKDVN